MLKLSRILSPDEPGEATARVSLDHDQRRRARLRVVLSDGREAGLHLPRGEALAAGARLAADDGTIVVVAARPEALSVAETDDAHLLARAAYHLGNRHVALAVEPKRLLYLHDHVLDGLCRELGLTVTSEVLPFEPEGGGYGKSHGHHEHSHGHHEHSHGHRDGAPGHHEHDD